MTDPIYTHLWYLPLILSLYLLAPIFQLYVAHSTLSNQLYFACLWFLATTVRPLIETKVGVPIGYYLGPVAGYIGYFVLGATIASYGPSRLAGRWLIVCAVIFLISYLITALGTYILLLRDTNQLDEYFYSHFSPNVTAMSLTAFILLRELGHRVAQAKSPEHLVLQFIRSAAIASFGVYLLHMIFLELLSSGLLGFSLGPLAFHPALAIPATSLIVFVASLIASQLMQRVRYVRWLVP